ncbi:MAG: excinuclease ABC subunit UvrC [Leptospirales bacterium]
MKPDTTEYLKEKVTASPNEPGCYLWIGKQHPEDKEPRILYVGKAIALRNRMRQYLNSDDYKTNFLMLKVTDLDWIVTHNEVEALLLENNLIKKHSPPYNIRLKDDKSYPYLCLTTGETYPRLILTRRKTNSRHMYFGPYSDAGAARSTMALLHQIFPIRKRALKLPLKNPGKPCLNYHIGRCLSPCSGKADEAEYMEMVNQIRDFLMGKSSELQDNISGQMSLYSKKLEFEKAARQRDILSDIQTLYAGQSVHADDPDLNYDIVGAYCTLQSKLNEELDIESSYLQYISSDKDHTLGQIVLLRVRNGNVVNKTTYAMTESGSEAEGDELAKEYMEAFLREYYLRLPDIPVKIVIAQPLKNREGWEEALQKQSSKPVTIVDLLKGEEFKTFSSLIKMAQNNAKLTLRERILSEKMRNQRFGLRQIQKFLDLPRLPQLIECYDISNIQGKEAVGAGVTVKDGILHKPGYRRYKIKTKDTPDDPAMMYEMLSRRMKHLKTNKKDMPDLVVIDGGITQLNAAKKARDEVSLTIPIVSLAKREEEVYTDWGEIFQMDKNSPGMLILRMARDEVHRFAVTYHRLLRMKRNLTSFLDDIEGIGPKKRSKVMQLLSGLEERSETGNTDELKGKLLKISGINEALADKILERMA